MEILFEKHKLMYLDFFSVSPKQFRNRRLMMGAILLLLGIALPVLTGSWLLAVLAPFLFLVGYKIPYQQLLAKKSESNILIEAGFPQFMRYFLVNVQAHGNVYRTFQSVVLYMNEPLKSRLVSLIQAMERGDDRRKEFMDFAQYIGTPEANMCMDMLHAFDKDGIRTGSLKEVESLVKEIDDNKTNNYIKHTVKRMEKPSSVLILGSLLFIIPFIATLYFHFITDALQFM